MAVASPTPGQAHWFFIATGLLLATFLSPTNLPGHERTLAAFLQAIEADRSLTRGKADASPRDAAPEKGDADRCALRITLSDAESGQAVPGLVRIVTSGGRVLAVPELLNRGTNLRANHPAKEWHVLAEPTTLSLPREPLRIEAFSGLETERSATAVDLSGKKSETLALPLRRFHLPARAGWRGGNTHLHLRAMTREQADAYLRLVPQGDGLELVFVSHASRPGADGNYISNTYTRADMEARSSPTLRFGWGEEHRNNFGPSGEGYGHVLFLDLPQLVHPVSIGPGITGQGIDFPALRPGIDRARADGATVIWCHNAYGFEHTPGWISGRLHAQNIFDGGTTGSYAHTFYRFLNLGLRIPFSAGTDWFIYDFSRVYVRMPEPLTVGNWLRALAAGRTFITNGPLLELKSGEHAIGDTIAMRAPGSIPIQARAIGRSDFKALELVQDGRMVQRVESRAVGGHFVAEITRSLPVHGSGWIAARTTGGATDTDGVLVHQPSLPYRPSGTGLNEMGEALFGHTSAIYLEVAGRKPFDREAALAAIRSMEASIGAIKEKGRFEHARQQADVLSLYEEAIGQLRQKLSQ